MQSRFDGDWEYTVGGGVAALDCDGSGAPSLFIAGGALVTVGALLWMKRRDYRATQSGYDPRAIDE